MIKLSVADLESALTLLKRTSHDPFVICKQDGVTLTLQFQNADGQLCTATLYDESTRLFAKVMAAENMQTVIARLK